jgi:outer membrane biosynthesis protein TonB
MLAATMNYRNLFDPMDLRRIIPSDITASAIAHLSLLTLFLLFSDVHPFGAVTAEQIPVEIVTPQEIAEKQVPAEPPVVEKTPEPVPAPTPQPDFPTPDKPAAASAPPPSAPPPAAAPAQKQAALAAPPAAQPQAAAPPQPQQTAAPAYKPPEPDLSVKYQVLLGLPPELPPATPPQARDKAGDNFDAPATEAADIGKSLVEQFRRHLKSCLKLPASLASSDDVRVKLRVLMTPQGKLAADPVLIEASASMKGPLLMQGAISALQACQPYAMLPVDRYGEWKVLDLSFTPRDF